MSGMKNKITVIGAGPSGMMAAISASRAGADVTLIEKNKKLGRKLLLTGNGRCNFTNTSAGETFYEKFGKNGRFLKDAFSVLSPSDLIRFFKTRDMASKTEEDGRVFPCTNRASDILEILEKEMDLLNVTIFRNTPCRKLTFQKNRTIRLRIQDAGDLQCDAAIICTGGLSYPYTGSSGDGFALARSIGHTITPLRPGLVPVIVKEKLPEFLAGLSLKKIAIRISSENRSLKTGIGDVIFTSKGLSGPLILSSSGKISDLLEKGEKISIGLDLFPLAPRDELSFIISRLIENAPSKSIKNCLKDLAQKRLLETILPWVIRDPDKKANQVTKKERSELASIFKNINLTVTDTMPIKDAMVTIGGVNIKEIDPKTMSSKIIPGVYFAGEIMDLAGDTGGFNLQAAFSTGYLAGLNAAKKKTEDVITN
jgi:predicted Rossmann fold flavoprotein